MLIKWDCIKSNGVTRLLFVCERYEYVYKGDLNYTYPIA